MESGRLPEELEFRWGANVLPVAALSERRNEIEPLSRVFLEELRERLGLASVEWGDDVRALLWRQPWSGNLRQLEQAVSRLVHAGGAEPISESFARESLESLLVDFSARVPSRRPPRRWILEALEASKSSAGRWNKTRAAARLGWDPDTLVARMRDLGIEPGERAPRTAWSDRR